MFELDNPTFLSNQYIRQVKLTTKLNKSNLAMSRATSDKYRTSIVPEKKSSEDSTPNVKSKKTSDTSENDQQPAVNGLTRPTLTNLNQKLIQEHKKVFSYNHFQQSSNLKHFIVNKPDSYISSSSNNIMNKNTTMTDTTDFENSHTLDAHNVDLMADIKMVNSEQTDDTNSVTAHHVHEPQQPIYLNRPKSASVRPVNKLIKNLKQKFNFKKNIVDIKLPAAIIEAESPLPNG